MLFISQLALALKKRQLGKVTWYGLKNLGVSKMNAIGNKIKSWFENQLACRIQKQTELSPFRSAAGSAVGSGHHRSAVHGKTNAVQSCQSWGFPGGAAVQPGLGSDWIRNSVRLQRSILCVCKVRECRALRLLLLRPQSDGAAQAAGWAVRVSQLSLLQLSSPSR